MAPRSKIYTRGGDAGTTGLGFNKRVSKSDLRIEACGSIDELNAMLGVLLAQAGEEFAEAPLLRSVSHELFDLGTDLGAPLSPGEASRTTADHVRRLESAIDRLDTALPALQCFILPGGTPSAAWAHLARAICRRAERNLVRFHEEQPLPAEVLCYINRLSDLLFVLARSLNNAGADDVLWEKR